MRRLLYFLKKGRFLLLFILLEIIAFALVQGQYRYHHSVVMGFTGDISYTFVKNANDLTGFFSLRGENKRLAEENALLKGYLSQDDKHILIDSTNRPNTDLPYSYLASGIIRNSFIDPKNYIVLDKGSNDGVKVDQGVVTSNGVCGIIVQVSPSFSICRSILHLDSHISARFKKNEFFGTVDWDGDDRRIMDFINIPREAPVEKGDTVITDRRSTLFPEGLIIGTVESVETSQMSDFHNIKLRLLDDFANISHVYIIDYKYKEELSQILDQVDGQNIDK